MNKEQFLQFHKELCDSLRETSRKKNEDYTGSVDGDAFANFTSVEKLGIASTEQGFLTRMMDKMQRVASFVKRGELSVDDEKVEETLSDLANYCILFMGYLRSKKDGRTKERNLLQTPATETRGLYPFPRD
jgi:hypothetical protein